MKYPIAIDIKKNRIRLHKAMLNKLGNPTHIQLLINPEKLIIAVRCVEKEMSGDQTYKIDYNRSSPNSIEMYSRSLVTKIYNLVNEIDKNYAYKVDGEICASQNLAYFSLENLQKIAIS